MRTVKRTDGKSALANPSIHVIEKEGVRRYRIWSTEDGGKYESPELTEKEFRAWQLKEAISKAYDEQAASLRLHVRNLSNEGQWWEGSLRPEAVVEQCQDDQREILELEVDALHADRCAAVAVYAITAYNAFLEQGGDPAKLPVMVFVPECFADGQFRVEMKKDE